MAWLDDSPVTNAETLQGRSAFIPGVSQIILGKWHYFAENHPFGKAISRFYEHAYGFVKSRVIFPQLNSIEKEIHKSSFQNDGLPINLLRKLMRNKKFAKEFFGAENGIYARCDQLIKILVQKSHRIMITNENSCRVGSSNFRSSHRHLLSLMQRNAQEIPARQIPNKLYWRSCEPNKSHRLSTSPTLIYMHATCQNLFRILTNKLQLSEAKSEVQFCHQNPLARNQQLVCGISLKPTPQFNMNPTKALPNSSFWQQSPTIDSIHELLGKNLIDLIDGFFFKTAGHYENFKAILTNNKEFELLNLILSLELKNLIVIEDKPSLKPNL